MKRIFSIFALLPCLAFAQVDFKSMKVVKSDQTLHTVEIEMLGQIRGGLDLQVEGKTITLVVPEAKMSHFSTKELIVDQKTNERLPFSVATKNDQVIFTFSYPVSLENFRSQISAFLTDGAILLKLPAIKRKKQEVVNVIEASEEINNERYETKFAPIKTTADEKKKIGLAISREFKKIDEKELEGFFNNPKENERKIAKTEEKQKEITEEIKVSASAPLRLDGGKTAFVENEKEDNMFLNYSLKIITILTIMIVVIYSGAKFIRKKTVGKENIALFDKLGSVQVINTSLLAPKKYLHLVKAGDQIILIGSSEQGIHMLSHLNNPLTILKESEMKMAGTNFENEYESAPEQSFRLKETSDEINHSKGGTGKDNFKEQMKSKIKNLRPINHSV